MPLKIRRLLRTLALAPILLAVLWPYLHGPATPWSGSQDQLAAASDRAELAAFYAAVGIEPGFCEVDPSDNDGGAQPPECPACTLAKLFSAARPDVAAVSIPLLAAVRAPSAASRTAILEERAFWRRPPGRAPPLSV